MYIIRYRNDFESDFIENKRLTLKEYGEYNVSIFELYNKLPERAFKYHAENAYMFKVEMEDKYYTKAVQEIINDNPHRNIDNITREMRKYREANIPYDVTVNLVSQIMPNGKERTEKDALLEQYPEVKKEKKDNPLKMAATKVAQKIIDYREKDIGKEATSAKPHRKS